MKNYIRLIHTPIGKMIAAADENAITSLDFTNESELIQNSDTPLLIRLEEELHEYFTGKRITFTLPLSPKGTPFQKGVWETLCTIPYGERISYANEAQRFGHPKAIRAVANANGRNPIAILIPCHRVIASGGGLGGYSGGIEKKKFLLELEEKFAL
ncbi:MAG: methylated-DNA--[protein]-cysteine S-methyltransferase [Sulfuricurvum sp.]|uniref:methylated-DNA--[protein]-cysteine S-methyltransferase n=1 Tax=Sulfuricurvum sp. TaxID=2025608 RepID=UPI002733DBF5|nr:methylated-DNA--[protein]-cysteine S-methyltransferase [Sulfuricurvum sp.]MDP2850245.1 methylated-DNA--[protein]-cysteine S-methyltransferase [Sulfuricurvum sp.]